MNANEYKTFTGAWASANEIMPGGKQLSPDAMKMVIHALAPYPLDLLLLAIDRHLKTGKFAPTPKDLIDMLEHGHHHIGADEAWGIALESFDEDATCVMTQEILEARGVALPIYEAGDSIGARMAFREAYNRIIKTDRKPEWTVSEGYDKARRIDAVTKAVQLGRLTHNDAARYLPAPMDGGPIGKLITGKVTDMPTNDEALRQRWGGLKQALVDGQIKAEERKQQQRDDSARRKAAFEQKKQDALAALKKALAD